jgi:hypothetical protein
VTGPLILVALVSLVIAVLWVRYVSYRYGLGPVLWRFFSGHSLDGRHRTNATWTRRATKVLHPTGHAVIWHHWPRWTRAGIRAGTIAGLLALGYGLLAARRITLTITGMVLAALIIWCMVWAWFAVLRWNHRRQYVNPLGYALTGVMGVPPASLTVAPDRSRVVLALPEGFTGAESDKEAITRAVTAKLAIEAPDATWTTSRKDGRPQVVFTQSVPPPSRVTAADILPAVTAAAEHEIVLGIGKQDQATGRKDPIVVSLDSEAPHLGYCMSTGDGKSTAAMNAATQMLHHGGIVVMLDNKLISHMWARGLPNVAYAGTAEELHIMLCWLAWDDENRESELTRRKKVALAAADIRGNVQADIGPRILVCAEELNSTQKVLRAYWRRIGGKGPSPAAEALEEIHFAGRQLRMHALDIAQRLSAKATSSGGGADSRENIGAIMFSNPSASTWKMLCDGHVQPPATSHKGRYQLVSRKTVRELQGVLWDEQEAREFATSGIVAVPRADMPLVGSRGVPEVLGHDLPALMAGPDQPFVLGQAPVVPGIPGAVTLREAFEAGLFPSVAAARKAVQRASLEPVGERSTAHLFSLADLRTCQSGRTQQR